MTSVTQVYSEPVPDWTSGVEWEIEQVELPGVGELRFGISTTLFLPFHPGSLESGVGSSHRHDSVWIGCTLLAGLAFSLALRGRVFSYASRLLWFYCSWFLFGSFRFFYENNIWVDNNRLPVEELSVHLTQAAPPVEVWKMSHSLQGLLELKRQAMLYSDLSLNLCAAS